jgi:Tol biopolymer transport system component
MDRRIALTMFIVLAAAGCGTPGSGAGLEPPGSGPSTAGPTAHTGEPTIGATALATSAPTRTTTLDSDWLAFEWYEPGRSVKDLLLMRPDGSERRVIASDIEPGKYHGGATWSPDGETIAFVVGHVYAGAAIWTVGIDGVGATELLGPDERCPLGVAFPSYSPDGRRLMYACQQGASGTSPDVRETLELLDLASGERTPVLTLYGQEELVWPSWSRDGMTAVFTVNTWAEDLTTQTGSYIATVPLSGGSMTPFMAADTWATDGRWSPTEDVIAYATHGFEEQSMAVRSTIETILPDGTEQRTIWPGTDAAVGRVAAPRWMPDGEGLIVSVATGATTIGDIRPATLTLDGRLVPIGGGTSGVAFTPRPSP